MDNQKTNTTVEATAEAAPVDNTTSGDTVTKESTHHHSHHHSSHHHSSHHHHRHHSSSHRHHHSSHRRHSFFRKHFSHSESHSKKKHSKTKVKSYTVFFLLLLSIVVAFFPDGLIKRLISDRSVSGMTFEQIFTYFNPSGATNTNFGPLLLTVVCAILLVMSIIQMTSRRSLIIKRIIPIVSVIAVIISLMPMILGVGSLSITGIFITLLMAFVFWLSCKNPFEKK